MEPPPARTVKMSMYSQNLDKWYSVRAVSSSSGDSVMRPRRMAERAEYTQLCALFRVRAPGIGPWRVTWWSMNSHVVMKQIVCRIMNESDVDIARSWTVLKSCDR